MDLQLRPSARAPSEARRALDMLRSSLDDQLVDDAVLLVSEVVTNSVQHADLRATDPIEVRISGTPSQIHVDVIDPGPGFDPARRRESENGQGGWGLWLLDRISSRWGVERNRVTRVWFELTSRFPPSPARVPDTHDRGR